MKINKRDVVRIGETLIGIDYDSPYVIVIIDAPKDQEIIRLPNGLNTQLGELRNQLGMKPNLKVVKPEPKPG